MTKSELERVLKGFDVPSDAASLFDAFAHEVYMIDQQYKIVYVNKEKARLYGTDLLNRTCFSAFPSQPKSGPCPGCPCREVLNNSQHRSFSGNECFEARDDKGRLRYINETAIPLRNKNGEKVLALVFGRDITKRVKLENTKKEFYEVLGGSFENHLKIVVQKLNELGYMRVRLYDVIEDCLSPENPLFVLRAEAGMGQEKLGYSFHLLSDGYEQVLRQLVEPPIDNTVRLAASALTEARLLHSGHFDKQNRCIVELELEGSDWILLPLLTRAKSDESTAVTVEQTPTYRLIGLLSVDNKGAPSGVTNDDLILLRGFADFLGEALVAVRAEMNLHISEKIANLINRKSGKGDTHQLIARAVCEEMQAGMCSIFIWSDTKTKLVAHANFISPELAQTESRDYGITEEYDSDTNLTGRSFARGQAFNVVDFELIQQASPQEAEFYGNIIGEINRENILKYEHYLTQRTGKKIPIKNALFAPLRFEEHNIGVIRVVNNFLTGCYPFPDSDLDLLRSIASQIAAHSHYEGMKSDLENAISEISSAIAGQNFDLRKIAEKIATTVAQMTNALAVTIFLKDEGSRSLRSIAKRGYPAGVNEELEYSLNVKPSEAGISITAFVALTGNLFEASSREEIVGHPSHSGKYEKLLYGTGRAESLIALPMNIAGQSLGVLKVEDSEPQKFSKSLRTMLEIMASLASLAIYSIQELTRRHRIMISLGHELSAPAASLALMGDVMKLRYDRHELLNPSSETLTVNKKLLLNYCDNLVADAHHLRFLTSEREGLDLFGKYSFKPASLKDLCSELTKVLSPLAAARYIDFDFPVHAPRCWMEMDADRLRRAFYNLLHNAIKYSIKNGTIEIALQHISGVIVVKIRDYGIGVPEDERGEIMKEGKRCRNASKADPTGQGLGLYFSRVIIECHGGVLRLTNCAKPTEFVAELPTTQPRKLK